MPHPHDLIVVRHGETTWNVEARLQGHRLDSPLTPTGRAQAEGLASVLAGLGVTATSHEARTSPLGRASETARLALGPLGVRPMPDLRLVEIGVGAWAGLSRSEIDRRWPGPAGEGLFAFHDRSEGGEGTASLAARAGAVLADLGGPAVLVTHGVTLRVLVALALGLAPDAGGRWPPLGQGVAVRVRDSRAEASGPAGRIGWPLP